MRRGVFRINGGISARPLTLAVHDDSPTAPPPTVPIPAHLVQQVALSRAEKTSLVTRAQQDNPAFTLRFEHIPGVDGSPHTVTVGLYTTEEQPPLCSRSWIPFDRNAAGRYEIRETECSGKGMFSLDSHAPGSLVACERPLVISPTVDLGLAALNPTESTIARMPTETRSLLLALHNSDPTAPSVEFSTARTNGFDATNVPGCIGQYHAVFDDISRINHCCSPNAVYRWNSEALTGEIRAVRPIAPGDEVFISYVSHCAPYEQRQEVLPRRYGFKCTCVICSLPRTERLANDAARQEAVVMSSAAACRFTPTTTASAVHAIKAAMREVRMLRGAGMVEPYAWAAVSHSLVEAACVLGDKARAERWARVAAGATRSVTGADGGWDAVAAAPERTELWMLGQRSECSGLFGWLEGGLERTAVLLPV
ncbi:SET domain-containing protein [Auriscalpium vulgare]|uniref:SET domain-containing protein n=1 Tax=Auriscalpium vulgare TaxID=40419 RepID=A0ACB8RDX0_9AGAM|nr:SET domain-containing protein [Auriscalpium vulgare]